MTMRAGVSIPSLRATRTAISRKSLAPAAALLVTMLVILALRGFVSSPLYYPYVVVDIRNDIVLHILKRGYQDEKQCASAVSAQMAAVQGACPACRIETNNCIWSLSAEQIEWLGEGPLADPAARIPRGIIVYKSTSPAAALVACQESETKSRASGNAMVECHAARSNRPLPSVERAKVNQAQSAHRTFLDGVIMLAMIAIGLCVTGSLKRRAPIDMALRRRSDASFRVRSLIQKLTLACVDALVILTVFALLSFPAANDLPGWIRYDAKNLMTHVVLAAITVAWFWVVLEHYSRRRPFWTELREIFRTLGVMFLLASAAVFYAHLDTGRATYLLTWMLTFAVLPLGRATVRTTLDMLDMWREPTIIVGTGRNARDAYLALKSEPSMGCEVLAFLTTEQTDASTQSVSINGRAFPILVPHDGNAKALLSALDRPQVIIALETLSTTENQLLVQQLMCSEHTVHVIPSIRGLPLFGTQLSHFFSHEVLFLTIRNNLARRSQQWIKRTFDVLGASVLLVLLSPLMAYVAWRIWREDGGPVIFKQPRIARNDGEFPFLKFRSMVRNADEILARWRDNDTSEWKEYCRNNYKLSNDPRLLSVGKWIRSTSIDELPQLFNVLRGHMSLVGPRPLLSRELSNYGHGLRLYRLSRPGLTGLWQVSGRSATTFADRANLDAWYVQNWSLWYDIAILFKTVDVVFNRRGAY